MDKDLVRELIDYLEGIIYALDEERLNEAGDITKARGYIIKRAKDLVEKLKSRE